MTLLDTPSRPRSAGNHRRSLLAALAGAALMALAGIQAPAEAASVSSLTIGETNTTVLYFSGQIIAGDLARLQTEVDRVPAGQKMVLTLESPGGLVAEGISIGRYVHQRRMPTYVIAGNNNSGGCHSACTFIFLAGRDQVTGDPLRIMTSGARVGFHQVVLGGLQAGQTFSAADVAAVSGNSQDSIRMIDTYFRDIQANPEFLTLVLSAPNSSITLLRELDALRLGIFIMDPSTQKLVMPDQFKQPAAAPRR